MLDTRASAPTRYRADSVACISSDGPRIATNAEISSARITKSIRPKLDRGLRAMVHNASVTAGDILSADWM